jgi:hypothetical protein
MSRIRNVRPEFFRHEGLQDIEKENPGKYPMLVFEGLWIKSDRQGIFEWRARSLKLDILPFLEFDMEETLLILEKAGYIKKYAVDGKEYGLIPTFNKHQKISKAEMDNKNVFPLPKNDEKPTQNGSKTVSKPSEEGLKTDGERLGNPGNLNSEIGNLNSEIGNSEADTPEKYFVQQWLRNPNLFNTYGRIEKTTEWKNFWDTSQTTKMQIDLCIKNLADAVKGGLQEKRFIPRTPDRFVLKGWIQTWQEIPKSEHARSPPSLKNRKSLGGLDA